MPHQCGPECCCRIDLDESLIALEQSTRMLAAFVLTEPVDLLEVYYAGLRSAKAKVDGAMAAYRDHLAEAA